MEFIKWYLPGRPPICTSARSAQNHFVHEPGRMPTWRVPDRAGPESYQVLPVREFSGLHLGPAGSEALRAGARANTAPGVSGEFQFESNMKIIKSHLSGRPLGCTSARPLRKHFDQEPRRMSIRRVPNRIAPGSYKVLPVREASGLHIGPAGSKALFPGARAVGARILGIQKELLFGTLFVSLYG